MRTVVVLAAVTAVAHANPAAEKVYRDGKALLAQGKTAEACDAFRRSQELEARVGTLLNLGDCEEKLGRFATAWSVFVDARALATRQNDPRANEADQRAGKLASKLTYLKLAIAQRPAGLVVRRNGVEVPTAVLDVEVPLDPGRQELEVSAPTFVTWKHVVDLGVGQRQTVRIPALVPDPAAVAVPPAPAGVVPPVPTIAAQPAIAAALPGRSVSSHRVGLGATIGLSTDADPMFGIRMPLHIAVAGTGTIRAMPTIYYSQIVDDADQYHEVELYAVAIAAEYVAPLGGSFVLAAGVGIGVDLVSDNYQNGLVKNGAGSVRLGPTLRLGSGFDVGVHLQVIANADQILGHAGIGVDYFFW